MSLPRAGAIRHVLCPVDFTDFSRRALDHAIAVARWYGARLTVLHVHPVPVTTEAAGLLPSLAPLSALAVPGLQPAERTQLLQQLAAFAAPAEGTPAMLLEYEVAEGDVAGEILAKCESADLVVMGTHGRSGFERFLLGSVAEQLLRTAHRPLLTIPRVAADATTTVPTLFHHIVAAVDFSAPSMHALAYALSLAEEAGAHLTILHVIDVPPHLALWVDRSGQHGTGYVSEWKAAALARLRDEVPETVRAYSHVEERVETGRPYREILRVAAEQPAGLVVIGAHGAGIVERMFVGSTAQHVVRQASCPVLTVREP